MKKPDRYIAIALNNDMSQILEQTESGFQTYTVMGIDNEIDWSNIVTPKVEIDEEDLFEYLTGQEKEDEMYME